MRVCCIEVVDSVGKPIAESPWLTIGAEYVVLAILARPQGSVRFAVYHGDGDMAVWDSRIFSVADDRMPPNWVVGVAPGGELEIGPGRWMEPSFWSDFHDGDPAALATYREELDIILAAGR